MNVLRGVLLLFLAFSLSAATTYHVSGNGSDANDGMAATTGGGHGPFRTIGAATSRVNPGDTVLVHDGTYTNTGEDFVVWLYRSGTPSAWITIQAAPGEHPQLRFTGYGGFGAWDAAFLIIDGFDIVGNNDNLTLDYALSMKSTANGACNGTGISFDGSHGTRTHHLVIRNNRISKCSAGGIGIMQSDYLTIENNEISDCCWYTSWATSGISTYQNYNFDGNTGYRMIIRGNRIHGNKTQVPWGAIGALSDGNGIIIDDSKNTQNGSTQGRYTGRTLVVNNLVYGNGGSGIHAYESEHVDIVNNTTWHNSTVLDYSEIDGYDSNDVNLSNNIAVAAPGKRITWLGGSGVVTYRSNLYFGSSRIEAQGTGDLIADPNFINPALDTAADFRLRVGSPGIDSGVSALAPSTDLRGGARPTGATFDRGAYEYGAIPGDVVPVGGTGNGLLGTYFPSTGFTGVSVTRTDATVNFDWGYGSPVSGIGVDAFSVRWAGQVQAQFFETYTFTTMSDDGVRLWVNGQQLINNWTDHGPSENSGTITLVAGQKYDVKMEYYENGGGAVAKLSWASPSTAKQIIPASQLYPSTPGALPAGWSAQDIGSVSVAGSTTQSNGTWTVSGSGADIWNNADGCRFASQRVTGDVQVTAQVMGLTNTDGWAKAGVMIRESLTAGSRHASTFATSANGIAFQRRAATDGVTSHTAGPGSPAPYWVRIERLGNVVISSTSPNGTTWTELRRETIAMSAAIYVGLAVTSHNNGALCTATFTNVQVVGVAAAAN